MFVDLKYVPIQIAYISWTRQDPIDTCCVLSACACAAAIKADEPVADPLGLKQVDLRIYQKTLVEDDTAAVVVSNKFPPVLPHKES